MPQFRFRATTPDGKIRSGRVTATDRNQAEQRIKEFGLSILDLSEGSDEPIKVSRSIQTFLSVDRVGAYFPAASLRERLARLSSWGITGYRLAALMAMVGLVWGGLVWTRKGPDPHTLRARGAREMSDQLFAQTFTGEISAPASFDLAKSSLEINFPEIPCQFSQPWSALEHPAKNQFVWKLEFLAPKKLTRCSLQIRLKDYHLSQSESISLESPIPKLYLTVSASNESPSLPNP